ncbi:hypothetical protein IFR04_008507 [Cadophora malorum]|uniref:Uncharacterized protein n=1 Tax=Cadophora malorum TaxID=108018 RepID=A0A8H7TB64_9HELO|nr:hypothetical protein IFR04_008507 [Cadophora malorum]
MSAPSSTPEPTTLPEEQQNIPASWADLRKIHPQLPETPPRPTRTVECNSMTYRNGEGVEKHIWIPKGTLKTASMHLENENWAALAKFPTYVDQGYADEGEAEEKERKTWDWLVDENLMVPAEPVIEG